MYAPERREPKPVMEIRFSEERSLSKSDSSTSSTTCGKSELRMSRDMALTDRRRSCRRSSRLVERDKEAVIHGGKARDLQAVEESACTRGND